MSFLSNFGSFVKKKKIPKIIEKPLSSNQIRVLKLETKLVYLTELAETSDLEVSELEEGILKLESEIEDASEELSHSDLYWKIDELTENLETLKKETDFFESMDTRTSNYENDVFDEESMSYESKSWDD